MKRIQSNDLQAGTVIASCGGRYYVVTKTTQKLWYGRALWSSDYGRPLAWADCHPATGYVSQDHKDQGTWWLLESEADLLAMQAHEREHKDQNVEHRHETNKLEARQQAEREVLDAAFAGSTEVSA